jgi:TonB family protein
MNRYVVLYVSTVFLIAGCGGATRKGTMASSDAALSFAMSTPVPSREIASVSECAATAECQRACEAGHIRACTRWGDMLHGAEPGRAEALWLDACQRRDGIACVRMMALAASEPRIADAYARHACAYGAVNACELLGSIVMLRGLDRENEQRTALLRDAAGIFEMACGFDQWQSCLSAGHTYAHKELASQPSLLSRLVARAFELAGGACEARDIDACLFRGLMLEKLDKLDSAKEHYARGCRIYLEAASTMPYADAVRGQPCRRASELAVAPPAESIERTESSDLRIERTESSDLPHVVREIAIEARRISGKRTVMPSAPVRVTMQRLGRSRLDAVVLMCLSSSGLVDILRIVESSEFASYDRQLLETMRTWRYSPYVLDGTAKRVCTRITFVYKQRN